MCFTYSCGCRMCMRLYLQFRTLYGYEIRNLFSLYRVQFNDGSSPLLNNYFRLQSQLQMHKLLWHDPRVNLTIAHRFPSPLGACFSIVCTAAVPAHLRQVGPTRVQCISFSFIFLFEQSVLCVQASSSNYCRKFSPIILDKNRQHQVLEKSIRADDKFY